MEQQAKPRDSKLIFQKLAFILYFYRLLALNIFNFSDVDFAPSTSFIIIVIYCRIVLPLRHRLDVFYSYSIQLAALTVDNFEHKRCGSIDSEANELSLKTSVVNA